MVHSSQLLNLNDAHSYEAKVQAGFHAYWISIEVSVKADSYVVNEAIVMLQKAITQVEEVCPKLTYWFLLTTLCTRTHTHIHTSQGSSTQQYKCKDWHSSPQQMWFTLSADCTACPADRERYFVQCSEVVRQKIHHPSSVSTNNNQLELIHYKKRTLSPWMCDVFQATYVQRREHGTKSLKLPCAAPWIKNKYWKKPSVSTPVMENHSYITTFRCTCKNSTTANRSQTNAGFPLPHPSPITTAGAGWARWQVETPSHLIWTGWRWKWLRWRRWEGSLRWCPHPGEPVGTGEHHTLPPPLHPLSPFLAALSPACLRQ